MARFFQDRGPVARRGVTKAELPAAATGTGVKGSASHSRPTAALNLPGAGAGHLGEHQRSSVNVNGILPFKVGHPRLSPETRGRIVEQVICTCPQPDWLWGRFYGRPYHLGSHRNGPGAAAIRTWANVLEWRMKTGEASSKLKQVLVQRPRMFGVA